MTDEEHEIKTALNEQKREAEQEHRKIEQQQIMLAKEVAQLLIEYIPTREIVINVIAELLGSLSIEEAREATMKAAMIKALRPFQMLMQSATIEKNGEHYLDKNILRENIDNDPAFTEIKNVMNVIQEARKKMTEQDTNEP